MLCTRLNVHPVYYIENYRKRVTLLYRISRLFVEILKNVSNKSCTVLRDRYFGVDGFFESGRVKEMRRSSLLF